MLPVDNNEEMIMELSDLGSGDGDIGERGSESVTKSSKTLLCV